MNVITAAKQWMMKKALAFARAQFLDSMQVRDIPMRLAAMNVSVPGLLSGLFPVDDERLVMQLSLADILTIWKDRTIGEIIDGLSSLGIGHSQVFQFILNAFDSDRLIKDIQMPEVIDRITEVFFLTSGDVKPNVDIEAIPLATSCPHCSENFMVSPGLKHAVLNLTK